MSAAKEATGAPGADPAAAGVVELEGKDLPAFCPHRRMPLWSQHPRVFLEVAVTGQARCPYCGTLYRLKPGTLVRGH
ncbi:MAG: zinc-finger domain-containing protein [Burkholderiaceae bacterium]|nr:zinc-finger domain-containing protein [Burkholderiaceae bacterium]